MKYLPLIWRNLGRNKLRTALTAGAIALAVTLVCLLGTMPAGMNAFLDSIVSGSRISIHNKAGIVYLLPESYVAKVRRVPGVVEATSWVWFGGAVDVQKGVTVPNLAVEAGTVGRVYEDYGVEPKAFEEFKRYRNAALVGRQALRSQGWRIGDTVTLQSTIYPVTLSLRIVGEIPREMPVLWFQRAYLEQAMEAQGGNLDVVGIIWARVDDPDRISGVMQDVDALFQNSEAETASETEKSFLQNSFAQLRTFVSIILLVSALVALSIVFIAANTASMSVRERMAELAIMKALGFRPRVIFATLVAETTILAAVAGALGAGVAFSLTEFLRLNVSSWRPELGPLGFFIITPAILVEGFLLALLMGILSGLVPSFGAARRSVVTALREVF